MSRNYVGSQGALLLAAGIEASRTLVELSVSGCGLCGERDPPDYDSEDEDNTDPELVGYKKEGIAAIAEALVASPSLMRIDLSGNAMHCDSFCAIATALARTPPALTSIDVSDGECLGKIESSGLVALAEALELNSKLMELRFYGKLGGIRDADEAMDRIYCDRRRRSDNSRCPPLSEEEARDIFRRWQSHTAAPTQGRGRARSGAEGAPSGRL